MDAQILPCAHLDSAVDTFVESICGDLWSFNTVRKDTWTTDQKQTMDNLAK